MTFSRDICASANSPLGRGDGSPLAGTAGDEIGQRLPQEVTEVASTQTALAGDPCGHGARRDSATGESGIVFPHETPAGIPIHDEALALALDEGQNAANAWRRERHMQQYSGEVIEELIGVTIRAERGKLR